MYSFVLKKNVCLNFKLIILMNVNAILYIWNNTNIYLLIYMFKFINNYL